jgi:hypothetical protein
MALMDEGMDFPFNKLSSERIPSLFLGKVKRKISN